MKYQERTKTINDKLGIQKDIKGSDEYGIDGFEMTGPMMDYIDKAPKERKILADVIKLLHFLLVGMLNLFALLVDSLILKQQNLGKIFLRIFPLNC